MCPHPESPQEQTATSFARRHGTMISGVHFLTPFRHVYLVNLINLINLIFLIILINAYSFTGRS